MLGSEKILLCFRYKHNIVLRLNSAGPVRKQVHDFDAQLMLRAIEQNGIKIPLIESILNRAFSSTFLASAHRDRSVYHIVRIQVCAAVCEVLEPMVYR